MTTDSPLTSAERCVLRACNPTDDRAHLKVPVDFQDLCCRAANQLLAQEEQLERMTRALRWIADNPLHHGQSHLARETLAGRVPTAAALEEAFEISPPPPIRLTSHRDHPVVLTPSVSVSLAPPSPERGIPEIRYEGVDLGHVVLTVTWRRQS